MIDKEQLKEIIEDLREVSIHTFNYADFNTIFSEACSYQRGIMISENRNKNYNKEDKLIPMTIGQEKFIRTNEKKLREKGFDIDNIQSKSDAYKIIKEFKEQNNK